MSVWRCCSGLKWKSESGQESSGRVTLTRQMSEAWLTYVIRDGLFLRARCNPPARVPFRRLPISAHVWHS